MRRRLGPLVLSLVLLGLARGEDSAEEARVRKVRELLDLGGAVDGHVVSTLDRGGTPAQRLASLQKARERDLDVLAPLCARHLDDETLDAALAFFASPAGRKYVAAANAAFADWAAAAAKRRDADALTQCKEYYDMVMFWKVVRKRLPQTLQDLEAPLNPGDDLDFAKIKPDPWGLAPVLRVENGKARIVSFGPDGVEGTADDLAYPER